MSEVCYKLKSLKTKNIKYLIFFINGKIKIKDYSPLIQKMEKNNRKWKKFLKQ